MKKTLLAVVALLVLSLPVCAVEQIKQGGTGNANRLTFFMIDSSDHITGKTGVTCTVTISKAGASYGSPSGTVTEVGNGLYYVAANATDNGTAGALWLHATGTGCDPTDVKFEVVAVDPQDAVHYGLSSLPNTAISTNGSLITSGTGTDQESVSGGKVLLQATQSGVTIPTVTTVTNQLTAAQVATGIWQDTTSGDFTTASSIGKSLYTSGSVPGAAGGLFIAGSNAATTVNITGTLSTVTTVTNQLTAAQIATGVWQDTTSGDFTTASSIGKSLYTSGVVPGGSGGLFIAGSNATTTANITGSLSGSVGSVTGNVGGNVTGSVGSISGVTFPTNFSSLGIGGTGHVTTVDTVTTVTNQLTAAAIATGVWQDATSGDFTVTSSVGKSLYTSGVVPGGSGGLFIAGSNAATTANITGNLTGNVSGSIGSVTGNVGGNVTGSVGSVAGDVSGKILGGGAGTITGTGVRAVDSSGNAIAPASTALSTAVWDNTKASYLDQAISSVSTGGVSAVDIAAAVWGYVGGRTLSSAPADSSGVTTLLTRLSAARAGYMDNINNANLANVPAFPTNFASLALGSDGSVSHVVLSDTSTTLTDKAGFSLADSQTFSTSGAVGSITGVTFPTNFATAVDHLNTMLEFHTSYYRFNTHALEQAPTGTGGGGGGGLTQQDVVDALKLAPSEGAPDAGSPLSDITKIKNGVFTK